MMVFLIVCAALLFIAGMTGMIVSITSDDIYTMRPVYWTFFWTFGVGWAPPALIMTYVSVHWHWQ